MPHPRDNLPGGVIHTYRKYDPQRFPMPDAAAPDLLSPAFDHLFAHGSLDELTPEQLAEAVELDPREIAGLGPSLTALIALLEERKRRILATYETQAARKEADRAFRDAADRAEPPGPLRKAFAAAVAGEQIRDLERLWYRTDERGEFARRLLHVMERLGDKYEVEELAAKYAFTGRKSMTAAKANEIKEELETIDRLLEQLRQAAKTAKVFLINMEELARFAEQGQMDELDAVRRRVEELLRQLAERQGIRQDGGKIQLTPKAFKLFQSKLLDRIFGDLHAAKSGRHRVDIAGDGAVELQRTRPYAFGDSLANMDVVASLTNAMIRQATETSESRNVDAPESDATGPLLSNRDDGEGPFPARGSMAAPSRGHATVEGARINHASSRIRLRPDDIEIHLTRNAPKCATVVCMDMSGSMRWGMQYVNVKRMALALHGLIRTEYPGDYVDFVEVCTLPQRRHISEVPELLPRPVTLFDPIVRLRVDMSDEHVQPWGIHPHFTNIQHGLRLARQLLQVQDTPNRQIILITDGLPTAHFEDEWLYMLYPPDPRTEHHTLREGLLCRQQGVTINIFLLQNWNQTREDVRFAHRLAESTAGRVFFTGGRELDRFVVWDYLKRRRTIIG